MSVKSYFLEYHELLSIVLSLILLDQRDTAKILTANSNCLVLHSNLVNIVICNQMDQEFYQAEISL